MNKVLGQLKFYRKEAVLAPLFKLLEATFELFVPLVMAAIVDNGIATGNKAYILKQGLLLIFLGIIGLCASLTAQFFAAKAAVGVATRLRHEMFSHIQSFSFADIDRIGTSTLITRITSDINQVQNGVNMVLRLLLRSPFIVGGACIMALLIDVKASLIFLIIIPALTIVVCVIMKITIPLHKKVQMRLDELTENTRENVAGVRVIRAFNNEQIQVNEFDANNEALSSIQVFVGKISGLMNPLTYLIVNAGIAVLIYKGALYIDSGRLTQGQVIALINYMSQILVELIKLANLIVTVTKAVACANRVEEVFNVTTDDLPDRANIKETTDNPDEFKVKESENDDKYIEFENVCLTYEGSSDEALSDISFSVKKGQTVGIIGGTGCGKTSLVHLIPGFYKATKGTVRIGGVDVKQWNMEKLREKVGIVMQKAVLFSGTIKENILWGSDDNTDRQLWEWLDISQSKEFVEGKNGQLEASVNAGGKNFSGGQRQRLTIARALARKPQILILDDSSSALDYATDAKLRTQINALENMTVFIVSQRTSSISNADMIIVLDDGKIAGIGKHEKLLDTCPLYKEIHMTQVSDIG